MSIQRQAMVIMTRLYAVYPDLEKQLSCRAAINLLGAMAVSGMFSSSTKTLVGSHNDERVGYVKSGIEYELGIRAIARALGIDENIASKFVRGCFVANKHFEIYPHTDGNFGSEYEAVARHLNFDMTCAVVEYLAGNQYLPALTKITCNKRALVDERVREKYGTFYLLKYFIKLENACNGLSAKRYFLDVINFIQSHPDRKLPRGEFTPRKIFIDEIIDYAREYDEVRFEQFHDDIATMLLAFDDCSTLPDCQSLKSKLGLFNVHKQIKTIYSAFADFIKSAMPESEDTGTPRTPESEDAECAPESEDAGFAPKSINDGTWGSTNDVSSDHESEGDSKSGDDESEDDAPVLTKSATSPVFEPKVKPRSTRKIASPSPAPLGILAADQQFDEDVARIIELSLREM